MTDAIDPLYTTTVRGCAGERYLDKVNVLRHCLMYNARICADSSTVMWLSHMPYVYT